MKIYIDTLGCAKNEYDSQMLAASLLERGCELNDTPDGADILIVNTCGFIEAAKRESIERILELAEAAGKSDNSSDDGEVSARCNSDIAGKKLVVCGCLAEKYHEDLARELPEVDMFFGVNDYDDLPDVLMGQASERTGKESTEPAFAKSRGGAADKSGRAGFDGAEDDGRADRGSLSKNESNHSDRLPSDRVGSGLDDLRYRKRIFEPGAHYGYLKIAEGCDNACSFCAIPSIRGPYRSKRIEDCVREAEDMADAGIRELILIAQDTSRYGRDLYGEVRLPQLLHEICSVKGIEWIRLLYVYDNGITDELIQTIKNEAKICKYIDMPIQHISNSVLRRMRRASTEDSIRTTIDKLRSEIPDVHIRTTILVGSPGETDTDIDELLEFIDTYKIDRLGAFAYSDEDGTAAHEMSGKIDPAVCEARRNLIMEHQLRVSDELNRAKIGNTYEVIIDEIAEHDTSDDINLYIGRSRYDAPEIDCEITFSGPADLDTGDIVNVVVNEAYEYDLEGEFVSRIV